MPFSTLAGAGFQPHGGLLAPHDRHPYPVRAMQETEPTLPPSETQPPVFPGDAPPCAPGFDAYTGAPPPSEECGPRLAGVCVEDGVWMHPSWAGTPLWPALRVPAHAPLCCDADSTLPAVPALFLDLNAVTPEIVDAMAPVTRRSLMDILGSVPDLRVHWHLLCKAGQAHHLFGIPIACHDQNGKLYDRKRFLGIPLGDHYRVDAATGLAMVMAQAADHRPFREVTASGITSVAAGLSGHAGTGLFNAFDTAQILADVLDPLPTAAPVEFRQHLDAASTLTQRYLEQCCDESPDSIRIAFEQLLRGLAPRVPRDPDHLGLCVGVILAGVAKYAGEVSQEDNHKRWRVAAAVNMIWAATSFAPFFFIAGPIAVADVATGLAWDRLHPVRDYTELLGHFETELTQLLLNVSEPWLSDAQLARLFMRLRQSFKASGLPG